MSMFPKILFVGLVFAPALAFATDPADLPVPPQGFASNNNGIPHGDVETLSYPTTDYGDQRVTVYTPPGYSEDGEYPVLYLHHGIGGNETAWITSEGNADNVMDYLYSEDLAVPMIVVMPDGNTRGAGDGFRAHEDVLLNDLIPWVEENYAAVSDADWRAIAGLSMGGGQTVTFGFPHSDVFHWLGAFSTAPSWPSPAQNIANPAEIAANMHFIFIACGDVDGLFNISESYHTFLDDNDMEHMWQIEYGEDHTAIVWNRSLYNFAQRIFKDLGDPGMPDGMGGMGGEDGMGGMDAMAGAGGDAMGGAPDGMGGTPDGMGGAGGIGTAGSPDVGMGGAVADPPAPPPAVGGMDMGMAGGPANTAGGPALASNTGSNEDEGCSCAVPGSTPRSPWQLLVIAGAAAAWLRRRRTA